MHVVRTMFKSNIHVLYCNNFKCQNHALEESSFSTRRFRGSKFPREIMFIIYAHPSPFSCGTIRHGWPLCCWCYRYIGCCSTFYPMLLPEYVDSLPNREFPALHIQGDPNQKLQFQIAITQKPKDQNAGICFWNCKQTAEKNLPFLKHILALPMVSQICIFQDLQLFEITTFWFGSPCNQLY